MRALRGEHGFTVIEAVMAAMILVIGGIAVLTAVETAARSTFRAEQSQVQINALQEEIERIRDLPFESVALTSVPTHAADQRHPDWRVSGTSFALERDGTQLRQLVYQGSALQGGGTITQAGVAHGPTRFQNGDVSGDIYRYVVWLNDDTCPEALCPGAQDKKRVIVAAVTDPTASGGTRVYQEVHTDLTDPEAERAVDALPPGGGDEDPRWQFWLTDTPCNNTSRQPIVAHHLTHNTLGACGAGMTTGETAGAPDLMFTEAAQLDPNHPPENQPLYDYATDVEPNVNPLNDRGLQMKVPSGLLSGTGCLPLDLGGITEDDKQWKMHKWLSPAIPNGYDVLLDGRGTLRLWTQTINGAVHPGRICVYLFTRQLNELGVPVDTPVVNLDAPGALDHFPYAEASWPSGDWGEINIPMHFAAADDGAIRLLPGTRLGLAIAVHRSGTLPGDGLQFNYDTPSFESVLELETRSLLPIFN